MGACAGKSQRSKGNRTKKNRNPTLPTAAGIGSLRNYSASETSSDEEYGPHSTPEEQYENEGGPRDIVNISSGDAHQVDVGCDKTTAVDDTPRLSQRNRETEKRHKRGENDAAAEIHHSTEFRLIDTHREELVVHGTTPETRHSSSGQPDDKVKTCITDAQQTNIAADKTSSTDEASRVFNRKRETDEVLQAKDTKRRKMGRTTPQTDSTVCEAKRKPVGLHNLGNTCYFNAVLQNIYQTLLLEDSLNSFEAVKLQKSPITRQLTKFFRQLAGSRGVSFAPEHLLKELSSRSSRFCGGRQQDSYEVLRHLMDGVKEEQKERLKRKEPFSEDKAPNSRQLTVVDAVFGGHFLTVFCCESCKMPYHLFEPYLDMSLAIAFDNKDSDARTTTNTETLAKEHAGETNIDACRDPEYAEAANKVKERLQKTSERPKKNSVLDCIRFHTRQEHLDDYYCLACNDGQTEATFQRATKETLVFNPPAILTIHLRRFEQTSRGYVKVSRHIAFNERLDLSPYCSRFAWRQQAENGDESFQYRLYGVVVHSGSLEGGHYTACVRMRTVDINTARTFLQKTFLDRQTMMSKQQLIKLVADHLPRERLCDQTYCEQRDDDEDRWFEISDTAVRPVHLQDVYRKEAYLLFYERIL